MITILTGPSTAGKTTLCARLRQVPDLYGLTVLELDDEKPPEAGADYWRRYRIELLLHEATERAGDTLISGALWPHEILGSESYDPDLTQFMILRVTSRALTKRLETRLVGRDPDDVAALVRVNRRLADALDRQGRGLLHAVIFNTAGLSRRKVADLATNHLLG